jgi:hypothetical protein
MTHNGCMAGPPHGDLQRSLARFLGTAAFAAAYREGKHLTPAQVTSMRCDASALLQYFK